MNIPKVIAVFGSSVVYGKNDVVGGGFVGRLRQWHEEVDIHNKTYNLGISGTGIDVLLDRLEMETKHRKVDQLILQLGFNDARREATPDNDRLTSVEEFRKKVTNLIYQFKQIAPTLVVSVYPIDESKTTPVSWRDVYFFADDIAEYATIMKNVSLQAGVEYIDIYGEWHAMENSAELYLSDDGLHANSAGHEYIFERIRDKLLSLYEE